MLQTFNANITFDGADMFGHFDHAVRNCLYASDTLNSPNTNPKTHLSMLSYCPRRVGSVTYKKLQDDDATYQAQLAADDDKSHRAPKSTELTLDVVVTSKEVVEKTPANRRAVYSPYVTAAEYDKSILGLGFQSFTMLALDRQGQKFLTTCDGYPQAYAGWLTAMDDWSRYMFQIANQTPLRRAVIEGKPISPDVFAGTDSYLDALQQPIKMAIMQNSIEHFRTIPYFLTKWFPSSLKEATTDVTDGAKKRAAAAVTPDGRTPKTTKIDPAAMEAARAKGFLIWKGRDLPKSLPVFYPKNDGQAARLCGFFITKGCYCRFQNKCNMHHPPGYMSMPAAARKQLDDHVTKTNGLEYVAGQGPAGAS